MACRIQSIKPPCAYNVEGIQRVYLLDFDDFQGFKFDGDDLYADCLVLAVQRSAAFVELETQDTAKYTSSITGGLYTHTLETFISALAAETLANLHLATKRRYLVLFQTKEGRYYAFGYDAGAAVTYANQTAEAVGSLVTASASSIFPLFEVTAAAMTDEAPYSAEFLPDFDFNTYCLNG